VAWKAETFAKAPLWGGSTPIQDFFCGKEGAGCVPILFFLTCPLACGSLSTLPKAHF